MFFTEGSPDRIGSIANAVPFEYSPKTEYSEAPLPLDPALAEVIFEWRRKTEFSTDSDFVFASPFMAREKPLHTLEHAAQPSESGRSQSRVRTDRLIGWHTLRHTYFIEPCHFRLSRTVNQESENVVDRKRIVDRVLTGLTQRQLTRKTAAELFQPGGERSLRRRDMEAPDLGVADATGGPACDRNVMAPTCFLDSHLWCDCDSESASNQRGKRWKIDRSQRRCRARAAHGG